MSSLQELLISMVGRISDLERRQTAAHWRGKVKQVNPQKGTARLILGQDEDGNDVLSPWLPYAQTAGAMKFHNPPSIGQQMEIQSQGGDLEQATLRPLGWSKENASPDDQGDRHTMTLGNITAFVKDNNVNVKVGEATLDYKEHDFQLTMGGAVLRVRPNAINLVVGGSEIIVTNGAINIKSALVLVEGGQLFHNLKNVGDTHTNGGVIVD